MKTRLPNEEVSRRKSEARNRVQLSSFIEFLSPELGSVVSNCIVFQVNSPRTRRSCKVVWQQVERSQVPNLANPDAFESNGDKLKASGCDPFEFYALDRELRFSYFRSFGLNSPRRAETFLKFDN